jgi:hypothetical protein
MITSFVTNGELARLNLHQVVLKDKVMMSLVRKMVLTVLSFNIVFRAKHIAGKSNVTADHLSRFHFYNL